MVASLGAGTLLALTPTASAAGIDTLDWSPCPADSPADRSADLPRADVLCATVPVPLDHDRPDGRTIDVTVERITATGERTGAVFGNPGGPGADARTLWYSALDGDDDAGTDRIRSNNDLVVVQPRGLDGSGALVCDIDPDAESVSLDLIAKWCHDTDPELVGSFTTENVVRDHEVVRRAMGLDTIQFVGASYGTALGMVYQTLFPDSLERLVLDSSVGPSGLWWYDFHLAQAENRYQARNMVLDWIARNDDTYDLGRTALQVYWNIRELDRTEGADASRFLPPPAQPGDHVAGSVPAGPLISGSVDGINTGSVRLDNAALASTGAFDEQVDGAEGYFAVLDIASRSPDAWSDIAWGISARIHGAVPHAPTPEMLQRQLEEEGDVQIVTSMQALYLKILNCNETAPPPGGFLPEAQLGSSDSVGSTGEDVWALQERTGYCLFPPSTVPPRIVPNEMAAPPLILQSDADPNTPGELGPPTVAATGGTLVRLGGPVHCHFDTGNEAVDALVVDYLRTGDAPRDLYLEFTPPTPGPNPYV